MRVADPNPLQKLVQQYGELFGAPPPMEAYALPEAQLARMIEGALRSSQPVAEWVGKPFGSRAGSKPISVPTQMTQSMQCDDSLGPVSDVDRELLDSHGF